MKRFMTLCAFGMLCASLGMTGDGCGGIPADILSVRQKPAIIPTNPDEETLLRTFEVNLQGYPETDSVTWEFGDGSSAVNLPIARGRQIAHEFTGSGTFTVAVHLFAMESLSIESTYLTSAELPVEVIGPNARPTAWFAIEDVYDDDEELMPLTKRMNAARSTDSDGTIVSYRWNLGDGTITSGRTVEHTYDKSGRYTVSLTVTDDRGATHTTSRTVIANSPPTAAFTATNTGGDGLTWSFDASESADEDGGIQQFRWDFGDDSATDTGMIVTHTYTAPDDYVVTLTVIDSLGTSATYEQTIDVTGTEPFVRSISPEFGEIGETLTDVVVDGENFVSGATVTLEGSGGALIEGTNVVVETDSHIEVDFDLTGASAGTYTVVVANPGEVAARLTDGFRVVTPNMVRLETSMGDIVFQLVDDAPITTANFLQYVEDGFYDGTIFHRVVADFVVQGGGFLPSMEQPDGLRDPIENEFSEDRSNVRGTVAMAKLGGDPDSATSQFFVNLDDNSENLDNQNGGFTVFASVVEGMDVVDAIAAVSVDDDDRPIDNVTLISATRE